MVNRIDPSKTPEANLYDLISKSNNGLSIGPANATLGTPAILATPVGNRDTEIPVIAVQDKGFSGTTKIRYNRLALGESVKTAPTAFQLAVTDTFETLKAKIIAAYGLIASEVVFNGGNSWALPSGSGATATLSMAPKAGSLMYNGNAINLTISRPQTATTYADFLNWMTTTYGSTVSNPNNTRVGSANQTAAATKVYEYTGIPDAGTMWGSPVSSGYTFDSVADRVLLHLLPSAAAWQDYYTNKRRCMVRQSGYASRSAYNSVSRNGYTSSSYGQYGGHEVQEFVYWDESTKRPMRWVNPGASGTAPMAFSLTPGEAVFTTPGVIQWTVPEGVFSVCVAAVGAGASTRGYGADGAGLGYKNNIPVTPGEVIEICVGATTLPPAGQNAVGPGGDSYFKSTSLVCGRGGKYNSSTGTPNTNNPASSYVGDGGGYGGRGAYGGGGAGGYANTTSGNGTVYSGGTGANANAAAARGFGGGAGGGGVGEQTGGAGGGGVGLYGQGTEGGAGSSTTGTAPATGGGGGSGGQNGSNSTTVDGGAGGKFGGGAGCVPKLDATRVSMGAPGAVRVVWGKDRNFPSNNVAANMSTTVANY